MLVKVKKGCSVFYDSLYCEGAQFELVERQHSVKKDKEGQPLVITVDDQFSENSMIRVEKSKGKPQVKKTSKEAK